VLQCVAVCCSVLQYVADVLTRRHMPARTRSSLSLHMYVNVLKGPAQCLHIWVMSHMWMTHVTQNSLNWICFRVWVVFRVRRIVLQCVALCGTFTNIKSPNSIYYRTWVALRVRHGVLQCVAGCCRFTNIEDTYQLELDLFPYASGLKGPAQCLSCTGEGVVMHFVPRPGGRAAGTNPIVLNTDDPWCVI